jgi:hypothetical protein
MVWAAKHFYTAKSAFLSVTDEQGEG